MVFVQFGAIFLFQVGAPWLVALNKIAYALFQLNHSIQVDRRWVLGLATGPRLPHRDTPELCLVGDRQRRLQEGV